MCDFSYYYLNISFGCLKVEYPQHLFWSRTKKIIFDYGLLSGGPGPEVINLFSFSTQLSTKFILPINVKMPTIVVILTFISMINTTSERLKARNFFICQYLSVYEQLKFLAQLS